MKLRVCLNEFLRKMTDVLRWISASAMFAREHLDNLEVLSRKLSHTFRGELEVSTVSILRAVFEYHDYESLDLSIRWCHSIEIVRQFN